MGVDSDPHLRQRFEQLWRWRRAAAWAPVIWFPLMVWRLLMAEAVSAVAFGLAGLFFAALTRLVVWRSRCPACGTAFRSTPGGFRQVWDRAACGACSCSLFELRRARARE